MGWRDVLKKEVRVPLPGLPKGWAPRGPRVPLLAWYAQKELHDMRTVFTHLASIVSTNASLPPGLRACAEDAPNARVARILRSLADRTESGLTLGDAMSISGGAFRPHWVSLVLASEKSGSLARALRSILDEINDDLESGHLSRNRIAYFVGLVVVQAGIMTFLVVRVMPIFSEILGEFAGEQPLAVGIFYSIYDLITWHYRTILAILGITALLILTGPALFRLSRMVQWFVTYIALAIPVVGPFYRARQLESVSSVMRALCVGGMPLPDALRYAARGRLAWPYARVLEKSAEAVERGDALSEALAGNRFLLGKRFIEFVRLGEGREDLAGAFEQARDLYRRRFVRRRRALSDALVPLGVAVCGSGVLLASISLYGMLTSIAESIIAEY